MTSPKPSRAVVLHEDGTTTNLWLHGAYDDRKAQLEDHAGYKLRSVDAIEATYWIAAVPMITDLPYNAKISEWSDFPVYGPVAITEDSTLVTSLDVDRLTPLTASDQGISL